MFISEMFQVSETLLPFILFCLGLTTLSSGISLSCCKRDETKILRKDIRQLWLEIESLKEEIKEGLEKNSDKMYKLEQKIEEFEECLVFDE